MAACVLFCSVQFEADYSWSWVCDTEQIELRHDIAESREALYEESRHFRKVFGREREQLSTLEKLGLDEREAVDYVLMLSREDENKRRNQMLWRNETTGSSNDQRDSTFTPPGASSSALSDALPRSSSQPLASLSASGSKVQTSPNIGPELPRSRGTSSNISYEASSSPSVPSEAAHNVQHFPSMHSYPAITTSKNQITVADFLGQSPVGDDDDR